MKLKEPFVSLSPGVCAFESSLGGIFWQTSDPRLALASMSRAPEVETVEIGPESAPMPASFRAKNWTLQMFIDWLRSLKLLPSKKPVEVLEHLNGRKSGSAKTINQGGLTLSKKAQSASGIKDEAASAHIATHQP